jgi:CheY-like chemotaxis protein
MQDLLRRTLNEQIELVLSPGENLWPVDTDANQVESALLNLVINARDAMPNGGSITIKTKNELLDAKCVCELGECAAGDYVVLSVTDNGMGMPPHIMAKAFDPFFTTKPIGQGTGLGLSMIYGFARQSGGHVCIESEIGEGTTVKLYLPRFTKIETQIDMNAGKEEVPRTGHGETVLLVEDEPAVRILVLEVLKDLGYAALEAQDGLAALPIIESQTRIDLLITDVGLPGLNGRQLAEVARKRRPGLKVLFITGYAEKAASTKAFLEPDMDLITKPFAMNSIGSKIRHMICGAKPA